MLELNSFGTCLYDNIKGVYGISNPQNYIFLQSFDGYTPLLLKAKQLLGNCDIAAIYANNEIPRYNMYSVSKKNITFVRRFYNLFLKTEFKGLRVAYEQPYIIGNGIFLQEHTLLSLAVVPDDDDFCGIPTILVSRGNMTEIIKNVITNYSYQPPFKVVNQEYLDSFKYTIDDLSPIDVCKILKRVENAKNN